MQLWPELLYPVRAHSFAACPDVGVLADDRRGVAAQFEDQALGPGGAGDGPAGLRAAGEADDGHLVGSAQQRAHLAAAVQQLYRLRGHARLQEQGHDRGGGGRCLRRSLDECGVARGERGSELVREEVRGGVEGGDGEGHPGRCAIGEGGVADAALPACDGQGLAADVARLGGAHREGVRDPVDLAESVLERFAQLQGEEAGQPLAVGRGGAGCSVQDVRAQGGGEAGHRAGRGTGVGESVGDLLPRRRGRPADNPAQVRACSGHRGTVATPLAGDVGRRFGHRRVRPGLEKGIEHEISPRKPLSGTGGLLCGSACNVRAPTRGGKRAVRGSFEAKGEGA